MTRSPSQKAELQHLIRLAQTNKAWRIYAETKARELADKHPKRWGWLPVELSAALPRLA